MATTNTLLQIFGSLSWRMHEDRNLFNQNFKAKSAWSISFGQRKSGSGAFPDFSSCGTLANSSGEQSLEIHLSGGIGILQSWNTSLMISLADSRFVVLYIPFLTNCEANEFAVIGQKRRVSSSADQAVNYIPSQPTGVREVDVIESLEPAIFSFFIKMGQQGGSSKTSCFTLRSQ